MPPPIIAHVHLPRCAGTAVWEALWVHFAGKVLRLQEFSYGLQNVVSAFEADPSLMAVSSHQLRTERPARIAGREVRYVTFLREPGEQVRSWIRYVRANYRRIPESTRALMELPWDLDRLPLDEAIDQLVKCLEQHTGSWFLPCAFFGYGGDSCNTIDDLRHFAVVGTVDNLDEGVQAIAGLMPQCPMRPRRVNESIKTEAAAIAASPRLNDFLDHALTADREVYLWASGLGFCSPGR